MRFVIIAIGLVVVAAISAPAAYGDPAGKRATTAWSRGVPAQAQTRALQLFQQGNVFFEQSKYTEAVAKYEQALASWDHPNIRFNMAICLINMRQPLVAWDHLKQALRFGDAPLGRRLHAEAMTYVAVLESSLAELTVKSSQPDVSVMIDGGRVQLTAGQHTMKLLAGKHQLVASRPGFATESRALDLPAGRPLIEQIELKPEQVKVEVRRENYDRRWKWWLPWAVTGGGVALGLIGSGVYLDARSDMKAYDRALAQACPQGCAAGELPGELVSQERAARRKSGFGVALWTGAGALAVAGGVLAVLNRPRKLEGRGVVPGLTVSRDHVGASITLALD